MHEKSGQKKLVLPCGGRENRKHHVYKDSFDNLKAIFQMNRQGDIQ